MAAKGANVVASLLKNIVDIEVARLAPWDGWETQAPHPLVRLRTNVEHIIMRVIQDMLLKGSPLNVEGLARIDVKCCVMGHL